MPPFKEDRFDDNSEVALSEQIARLQDLLLICFFTMRNCGRKFAS